jgi:hypothetical protein
LATDIRVDVTDQDGNPLPGYTVEADLTKAGTPSTTSATTADEGRITFRVQTTQPGINTFAISRVIDPNQIRCNFHVPPPEPQAWTPGEEAAPTPTPDLATLGISCDHRIPGVESDIIVRGSGEPGRLVTLLLSGPGVIGSGEYVATADANGNFGVRMPINRFGPYIVDVDFQWQYSITVGDVCDG